MYRLTSLLGLLATLNAVHAQVSSSWPHDYPGKPKGDLSSKWQSYFQVKAPLPNVTFPVQRSWAGNIAVDRAHHPNDTLFFWAWEKHNGSFTAESDEPWGIWLQGGPGSSSMVGMFFENGPLHLSSDYSMHKNNYSWSNVADYVWVDQPVGTGFSTADATGFIEDEDQMGEDFMKFLANLVKVFPNLKTRPLHLTGESYAGTYIPYITKTYFGMKNPPVKLARIAIGDGAIGNFGVLNEVSVLHVIETYPQLIGYDPQVYAYFKEQHHLCGLDLNLSYPQPAPFPTVDPPYVGSDASAKLKSKTSLLKQLLKRDALAKRSESLAPEQLEKKELWKRDLSGRANGTIDPWYECDLFSEVVDYALNYSLPWKGHEFGVGFDFYDITDALQPQAAMDAAVFLNNDVVRAAIHAPTSKDWQETVAYPFGSSNDSEGIDPSPEPMVFLTELATNATEHGVHVIIYAGNDDCLIAHTGQEVVIQNTTFGGIQGFTRPPATPWYGDDGEFAGIVHQERNWTYVLVKGAGHLVPKRQPERAFALAREFIFGSNTTGLVVNGTVIGGENATLAQPVLPGQLGIYVGSATTQSTYTAPSVTIAAWESFAATAITSASFSPLPTARGAT